MVFGEIVRAKRRATGLTLEGLAKKIDSHKGYISGIENGKVKPPSWKVVRKLCTVLDLNYESMLFLGWAQKAPKDIRDKALSLVASL
jgi:transcriptional regulator with XRE-family HTH domain